MQCLYYFPPGKTFSGETQFGCDFFDFFHNLTEAGVEGDFAEPIAVVDAASGDAGAMPDEGPPKTVQTKESLRGTLPKKAMDYQVSKLVCLSTARSKHQLKSAPYDMLYLFWFG